MTIEEKKTQVDDFLGKPQLFCKLLINPIVSDIFTPETDMTNEWTNNMYRLKRYQINASAINKLVISYEGGEFSSRTDNQKKRKLF